MILLGVLSAIGLITYAYFYEYTYFIKFITYVVPLAFPMLFLIRMFHAKKDIEKSKISPEDRESFSQIGSSDDFKGK